MKADDERYGASRRFLPHEFLVSPAASALPLAPRKNFLRQLGTLFKYQVAEDETMMIGEGASKCFVVASVVAGIVLFGAMSAQPATYYVSQSSGNDSWSGQTEGQGGKPGPWKTLAKASTIEYSPGDRVLLKCGDTWDEEFHPKGEGTPEKPIIIGSYAKGKKPVIDRQDYNKDLIGIHLADQGGFKIVGIEFNRCMTGIYAEYSAACPTKKFIWIEDCYFHDSLKYGDYKTYPTPRNIGLGVCFFSFARKNRIVLTDITIKNCVFRRLASGVWTNSPDNFNKYADFIWNFGNMTFDGCLFEEGFQWQMGVRGVAKGVVWNCVTHDIGRGFRAWNGVAGAMFFRCKDWVFEDSEWGYVDMGHGSGDGQAFDFEGSNDGMIMRNCLFHDTDGPGFLVCRYASSPQPNKNILMENCVINGKSKRPIGLPRCAIVSTTGWNDNFAWKNCRFYLSHGEKLLATMDGAATKMTFTDCITKNLSSACGTEPIPAKQSASTQATASDGHWFQLDFGKPVEVNEFKIKEATTSSITRYVIQYWDDKKSRWASCFNGAGIGAEFVAPIVGRTTSKARLLVLRTNKDKPALSSFEAYNDTRGDDPALAAASGVVKAEKPFPVRPGVIHIEAENLTGRRNVTDQPCPAGGLQLTVLPPPNAMKYEFDVPEEGIYVVTLNTSSGDGKQMDISAGGHGKWEKGSIKLPAGASWKTSEGVEIELEKGHKTLWMSSPQGGFKMRWIELALKK